MEAYINGIGLVSTQNTFGKRGFPEEWLYYHSPLLHAVEPSYKEYLNPALARRMGRIIKMSIAASSACMKEANITMPDAIITGTALGCHEDTEKFLLSIIDNEEQFLTPTSFMQSTHNTVSAQIALQLKCMNYNFTYVHKGFSFETALLDGMMTLAEGRAHNILIGGHDEITEKHFKITSRIGYWKEGEIDTKNILNSTTSGSIAGEGAAFFLISDQPGPASYAKIIGLQNWYKPENNSVNSFQIQQLLKKNDLETSDIDLVIYGSNGDHRFDPVYDALKKELFLSTPAAAFKQLSGEYQTSAGFAVYLAANILSEQLVPTAFLLDDHKPSRLKNILIYNHFMNVDHSAFLLTTC